MGIFDRFKQKQDKKALQEKATHSERQKESVKAASKRAEEEKKKSFQSVPAAGKTDEKKEAHKPAQGSKSDAPAPKKTKGDTSAADRVLVKPIITEKSGYLSAKRQYVFKVHPQANKIMIQKAIEANYGVRPTRVNILNVAGRSVRYGRTVGRTNFWKKAIVTLPEGKTIDVYEA